MTLSNRLGYINTQQQILQLITPCLSEFKLSDNSDPLKLLSQIKTLADKKCTDLLHEMISDLKIRIVANDGIINNLQREHKNEGEIVKKRNTILKKHLGEKITYGLTLDDLKSQQDEKDQQHDHANTIKKHNANQIYMAFHIALKDIHFDYVTDIDQISDSFIPLFKNALARIFPQKRSAQTYSENHEAYCNLLNLIISLFQQNQAFFQKKNSITLFESATEVQTIFQFLNINEKSQDGEPVVIRGTALFQLKKLGKLLDPLCRKIIRPIFKADSNPDYMLTHLEKIPHPAGKLIVCISIALRELGELIPEDIQSKLTSALNRIITLDFDRLKRKIT